METPEVWLSTCELAFSAGARDINSMQGCWERSFGPWFLALNGHGYAALCTRGRVVNPFSVYVEYCGVAAGMVGPESGVVACSDGVSEDLLVAELVAETVRVEARGQSSGAA